MEIGLGIVCELVIKEVVNVIIEFGKILLREERKMECCLLLY